MEEYSSTELGPDKSMQLKEIDRAMAAEKHQQDKEQKTLTDEFDENQHRRYMEKENSKRETIRLEQEEAMRIREHEEKMAAENHKREMDKLKEQKESKMLDFEILKLQLGEAEKARLHEAEMEAKKHEREMEYLENRTRRSHRKEQMKRD